MSLTPQSCLEFIQDLEKILDVSSLITLEQAYQLIQDLDRYQCFPFTRRTDYMNNTNKVTTVKSQLSQFQSQSRFGSSNSTHKYNDKDKGVYNESSRSIHQNRCFKCQEFGHIVAQCPSKTRTLIIETQSDSDHDDLEEIIHDPE